MATKSKDKLKVKTKAKALRQFKVKTVLKFNVFKL